MLYPPGLCQVEMDRQVIVRGPIHICHIENEFVVLSV